MSFLKLPPLPLNHEIPLSIKTDVVFEENHVPSQVDVLNERNPVAYVKLTAAVLDAQSMDVRKALKGLENVGHMAEENVVNSMDVPREHNGLASAISTEAYGPVESLIVIKKIAGTGNASNMEAGLNINQSHRI